MWILEPDCDFTDVKISVENEKLLIALLDKIYKYRKNVDRAAQQAANIMEKNVFYYNTKDSNRSIRRGREEVKCVVVGPDSTSTKESSSGDHQAQLGGDLLRAWHAGRNGCHACCSEHKGD
jgi:predicted Zn-dependent protease